METITILATALSKASKEDITRLDIQYNSIDDYFIGYLYLGENAKYGIHENGTVTKLQ